jgi:hypothetical protein
MVLRISLVAAALLAAVGGSGCCHKCGSRACASPAIVNTAPVACPCPDPCTSGAVTAPAVPAYSSPAPCCNGYPR